MSGSSARLAAARRSTSVTSSTLPNPTGTSTTTRAQPWLRLPTRMISPLRMYHSDAAGVADGGDPQPDRLDGATDLADIDQVADPVLVFEQHEQAGDEVLDQVLGAETEGDTDDAGAGDQGSEVHPEFAEDHHRGDYEDRDGGAAAQHRAERLSPLTSPLRPPTVTSCSDRRHPLPQRPRAGRAAVRCWPRR